MPVYELSDALSFPPTDHAEEGLLAVGGDLRPERLIAAYRCGVFPWPHHGYPMLWFSPDPRFVLRPGELHVGRSLRKVLRSNCFEVRIDSAFDEVMLGCATGGSSRGDGTWITPQMRGAYGELHRLGHAHSCEAWRDGRLVGGLYGVVVGGCFTGESMFAAEADASKVAFVWWVRQCMRWGIEMIDCQTESDHLARFGARPQPRARFVVELERLRERRLPVTDWAFDPGFHGGA